MGSARKPGPLDASEGQPALLAAAAAEPLAAAGLLVTGGEGPLRNARLSGNTPGPLGSADWADPDALAFLAAPAAGVRLAVDAVGQQVRTIPSRVSSAGQRFAAPLQKARAKAREQHEKRDKDEPLDADPQVAYQGLLRFQLGRGDAPVIRHDHGFLDDGSGNIDQNKRQPATVADHLNRAKWVGMLEGAELLRPDLVDATSAYRHFLFGDGADRRVVYERFVQRDSSGRRVLESVFEDVRAAAIGWHDRQRNQSYADVHRDEFTMHSDVVSIDQDNLRYPYPATENWQKAIGGHALWVRPADVAVVIDPARGERRFSVSFVLEMEDMYNFNPNNVDIETGIPDQENGRFEVTELGHEYKNRGSLQRTFQFTAPLEPVSNPRTAGSAISTGRAPRPRGAAGSRR